MLKTFVCVIEAVNCGENYTKVLIKDQRRHCENKFSFNKKKKNKAHISKRVKTFLIMNEFISILNDLLQRNSELVR